MNRKSVWQVAPMLATTFTLSALVGCSFNPTTSSPSTTPTSGTTPATPAVKTEFFCVQDDQGNWVTIAQRNNFRTIKPMLQWQTTEFGDNWTPEKRCNHVTEKLNKAVGQNNGYLSSLALTYGPVGNYTVICVASSPDTCTADNMLFTLKPDNAQQPKEVLAKIAGFAQNQGADNTILESGNSKYLLLEDLLDGAFPSETRL
jgi:hypothetical protein